MIRLRLHFSPQQRMGFLLTVFLVGLLLVGAILVARPHSEVKAGLETSFFPRGRGNHFYVTNANHAADEARTACTAGYHMASLWEILDVSNLYYDYDHPEARLQTDSGFGPPAYWFGWVRTGWDSNGANNVGTANCEAWSAAAPGNYGSVVRLARTWETDSGDIFSWDASTLQCTVEAPVWCVGDFQEVLLPLVMNSN